MEEEEEAQVMNRTGVVHHGKELDPSDAGDRVKLSEITTAAIRLRNQGATPSRVADALGLSEEAATELLEQGLAALSMQDASEVRGRQQAMIHDFYAALYPTLKSVDTDERIKAVSTMRGVMEYEGKLHGATAPQRVQVGLDQEAFSTRVEEDLREIGVDPKMDVALEEDDGTWSNT